MSEHKSPETSNSETLFRIFLAALWVARVPVASLAIAFALFLGVPQVQDQLIELKLQGWHTFLYWSGFFIFGLLFWVLPVHFSARIALQLRYRQIGIETEKNYRIIVVWLPRILAVLCLLSISVGILQAWSHVPNVEGSQITGRAHNILFKNLLVSLGLILLYLAVFWALAKSPALRHTRRISPRLFSFMRRLVRKLRPNKKRVRDGSKVLMARAYFLTRGERLRQRNTLISLSFFLLLLWLLSLSVWLLYLLVPHGKDYIVKLTDIPFAQDVFFEYVLPRAIFLMTAFGWFVPFLTIITVISHKIRHPLLVYGALLLATFSVLDKHRFDVRVDTNLGLSARIPIDQAVKTWMRANDCDNRPCQPIIVAAEGGASRAAFFTASALALLQDKAHLDNKDFAKSVFAVTGVSGGALGTAAYVLASEVQKSGKMTSHAKCGNFCGWFGWHLDKNSVARTQLEKHKLTKNVQLFLANDFLTPSLAAYVFYDMFKLGWLTGAPNRVVHLENGWERHFKRVTGSNVFGKHFSSFAPKTTPDTTDWRPLMVFYGSSVETGKRIIVSPLAPRDKNNKSIFRDSDDLYELICKGDPPRCDIPMSTAVTTSARFPVVSAPGNIVGDHGNTIAHVVDGGYFDYFAITTAVELAQAFHKVAPNLRPKIVLISNDPVAFPEDCGLGNNGAGTTSRAHTRTALSGKWFRSLRDPLDTALNSRIARARHAAETATTIDYVELVRLVVCPQRLKPDAESWKMKLQNSTVLETPSLDPNSTRPGHEAPATNNGADKFKHLSMSWWLSLPVQEYLHKQLYNTHNCETMDKIIATLPENKPPGQRTVRTLRKAKPKFCGPFGAPSLVR